ncbi:MAG: protein kinase [Kofleriaceae bacterium]|nr:protein kinase [Kofleriaceae bacterium]
MADESPLAHSPTLVGSSSPPRNDEDELAPGTTVGEYVVERFLGAGAMGEVYAGKQPVIGKKVAIKVLKREVGASADGAERFTREARAVNQVDHPGVIDIFSFGRMTDGRLYLVMDLVEGKSLRKALIDGPLDAAVALDVLDQIAAALDAAHARGVIHRDLKPDNVMLGSGDPPKVFVLDFGLAKLLSTGDSAKVSMLTGQGTWLGTPGYMAPEQWSADGAGPASDRYSLGVIAFELLSGSLPFKAESLPQMMEQHFRAKVPALSSRGAIPASAAFDPILTRAMAKNPAERFATAREMVAALRAVAGGTRVAGAAAPTKLWIPAVAGAGVLGLSVAAVLAMRGSDKDPRRPSPSANPVAVPGGKVRIELLSVPPGAEVRRAGNLAGITPLVLDVLPNESFAVELRKPGYTTLREKIDVSDTAPQLPVYRLAEINGFEGVWALPGGQLRAFKRNADKVSVSKLDAVDGPQTFYRHLELVHADSGVTFATNEEMVDPRAPNEPSCHVPHRVEYHYEPATDAFEVRRERVVVDIVNGSCVIRSATLEPPLKLARADQASDTERVSLPPVGKPILSSPSSEEKGTQATEKKPVKPSSKKLEGSPQKPVSPKNVDKLAPDVNEPVQTKKKASAPALNNEPPPPQTLEPRTPAQAPQEPEPKAPLPPLSKTSPSKAPTTKLPPQQTDEPQAVKPSAQPIQKRK